MVVKWTHNSSFSQGFDGSTVLLEGTGQSDETFVTLLTQEQTYANAHLVTQEERHAVRALGFVHRHTQLVISMTACDAVQLQLNNHPVQLEKPQWSAFVDGLTVNVQLLVPHNATYVVVNTSNVTVAITQQGCALVGCNRWYCVLRASPAVPVGTLKNTLILIQDVIAVAAPWLRPETLDGLLASTLHRVDVPPTPPADASHYAVRSLLAHDAPCNRFDAALFAHAPAAEGGAPQGAGSIVTGGPLARIRWSLEMINGPAARVGRDGRNEDDEDDEEESGGTGDGEGSGGVGGGVGGVHTRGASTPENGEGKSEGALGSMPSAFDAAMALAIKQQGQQEQKQQEQ